jgi:hypothetical protein
MSEGMTPCRTYRPAPIMMKARASTAIAEIGPPFEGSPWLCAVAGPAKPVDVVVAPLTVTFDVAVGSGVGVGDGVGVGVGEAVGVAEGVAEGVALGDAWRGTCARAAEGAKTTATKSPPARRTPNLRIKASRMSRVST